MWKNIQSKNNLITYIQYSKLATDQSNGIHDTTFWCYFDLHANITRMSNNPPEDIGEFKEMKKKLNTPGTIIQKFSLNRTNSKIKTKYKKLVDYTKGPEMFHEDTRNRSRRRRDRIQVSRTTRSTSRESRKSEER